MNSPLFLTIDEILLLHEVSLMEHGGAEGIRDWAGFESAALQPVNDFHYGGADLFGVAAAYAYHLSEAQVFLDGNKRAGMSAALAFLELNGIRTTVQTEPLHQAMLSIARRELTKPGLAALLRMLFAE